MNFNEELLFETTFEKIKQKLFPSQDQNPTPTGPIPSKTKANIEETLTYYYLGKLSLEDTLKYIKIQLEAVKPVNRSEDNKQTTSDFLNK